MMNGSDGGGGLFALLLLAAGPGAGIATWMWIQGHYRNRSARYRPESVVHHRVVDLRGDDALVRRLRSRSRQIGGGNDLRPEQRAGVWRVLETPVEAPPPEARPGAEGGADPDAGPDAGPDGEGRPPA